MHLERAIDQFFDYEVYVRGIAPTTARTYRFYLTRYKRFVAQHPTATPEHYLAHVGRLGYSDEARNTVFKLLRHFYNWARDRRKTRVNPLDDARPPIVHQKPQPSLTKPQALQLLATVRRSGQIHARRDHAILATLFYAGLRIAETLRLRPRDLDIDAGTLTVIGKGSRIATVPMHPDLRTILISWLRLRAAAYPDAEFLFPSKARHATRCGQLDPSRVQKLLRVTYGPAAELVGLAKSHALRRGFAQHLRRKGVSLGNVQRLLRHRRVETTMIYLRESSDDLGKEIKKF